MLERAYIFDLDFTITEHEDNVKKEDVNKLICNLLNNIERNVEKTNNVNIFVVTTRQLFQRVPDNTYYNTTKEDIRKEHKDLFTTGINKKVVNKFIKILKCRHGKDKTDDKTDDEIYDEIYDLNLNPDTRWLYSYVDKFLPKELNIVNETCIVAHMLNNIFYKGIFDNYGDNDSMSGPVKMNQIIEIKERFGYDWENIYFFDDAYHNYKAWCLYAKQFPGMKKLKYFNNNRYSCDGDNVNSNTVKHVFDNPPINETMHYFMN